MSPECRTACDRLRILESRLPSTNVALVPLTLPEREAIENVAIKASATCEEFLERRCLSAVNDAEVALAGGVITRVAKFVIAYPAIVVPRDQALFQRMSAYYGVDAFQIRLGKGLKLQLAQLKTSFREGKKVYERSVKKNHGFSSTHIYSLAGVIGVDYTSLDPVFLTSADQLKELRGAAAHTTLVQATTIPDPNSIRAWLATIRTNLKTLDRKLGRAAKSPR